MPVIPPSSCLIRGDRAHAFRDPAVLYEDGLFHLFCTMVETEDSGDVYMYVVSMTSADLAHWTPPRILTPRDKSLNFSSPGNAVRHGDRWVLCLQTYCRENGEKYGNARCRLWRMDSADLEHWSAPRLLNVQGPDVPSEAAGRMIDPYLIREEKSGLWHCFYKHNGIRCSVSPDLERWEPRGAVSGGENPCIVRQDGRYILFASPKNGISVHVSNDLTHWTDTGTRLTFGQDVWPWARGRLTAGAAIFAGGLWYMFFHGTGPEDESVFFDTYACIGAAWSEDLEHWRWK